MATLAGCRALTYPHTTYLLDDGRRPEMEKLAELAGARLPDPRRTTRTPRPATSTRRCRGPTATSSSSSTPTTCRCPTPSTRWSATSTTSGWRSCRRPHDFFNHDSVQHYGVGRHEQSLFYRVDLPRQGPPRRRLLVRLGGADQPPRPARDRRRRHRDDRRGLPHDDPAAAPRLAHPLPRRGPGPGPGAARPRRLPAAARPLGARQPRRLHPAGVAAAGEDAEREAAALLPRQPARLPGAADAAAAPAHPRAWCSGPASCR